MALPMVMERLEAEGPRGLENGQLLQVLQGSRTFSRASHEDVRRLAWLTPAQLRAEGYTPKQAAVLSAAFELGRRGAWDPPAKGDRCLDPRVVYQLMRNEAREEIESFYVILLDVRGRLMGKIHVAKGSLTQCPVSPRDALRPAVQAGAHSVVFVHNHPSGDTYPSAEDVDLTERLRAAAEIVGVMTQDHVIVGSSGYYSFVEAGRWRR